MTGLQMKYFVLRPHAKSLSDHYALASRQAMLAYARAIRGHNEQLANELEEWVEREEGILQNVQDDEPHPCR